MLISPSTDCLLVAGVCDLLPRSKTRILAGAVSQSG